MTREEAISVLKETIDPNVDKSFKEWREWDKEKHLPAVNMAIEALQAEPRLVSRWIDADLDPNFAKCKNCSEHEVDIAYSKDFIKQERWNFCPYCGAKMDKE